MKKLVYILPMIFIGIYMIDGLKTVINSDYTTIEIILLIALFVFLLLIEILLFKNLIKTFRPKGMAKKIKKIEIRRQKVKL